MNLIPFEQNGWKVRVVERDGEPWFVAKDVAEALGYAKPENAVSAHCKASVTTPKQGGGFLNLIPERDVYRLIMRSKLPDAERFEEWVVGDVLPSIRKTGSYSIAIPRTLPEALRAYADEVESHQQTKAIAAEMKPKADFYDHVVDSKDAMSFRDAAKLLNMRQDAAKPLGQNGLFEYCRNAGVLMGNNQPYQKHVDAGHFRVIESSYSIGDETKVSRKTLVMQRGLDYLRKRLSADGYETAE